MNEKKDVYSEKLNVCWDDKSAYIYDEKTGDYVAEVFGKDEEKWPRAYLVAAAPELLRLLEVMTAYAARSMWEDQRVCNNKDLLEEYDNAIRDAERAIKKARGENNE